MRFTVGVIFDSDMENVMMLRRTKNPFLGMLNGVGGKIEPGECVTESFFREMLEETDLEQKDIGKVSHMFTIDFPNGVELNCCYAILDSGYEKKEMFLGDEGVLLWFPVFSDEVMEPTHMETVGCGNIPFMVVSAMKSEGLPIEDLCPGTN